MFRLILIAFIGACYGEQFVQDVVTSILKTVSEGVEKSRMAGNKQYQLFIQWKDEKSRLAECDYCHFFIEDNETIRQYTDDDRKYNYASEAFVFPTANNSKIPMIVLDKQQVLTHILKELIDLFELDIQLNGDTCCHYFTIVW
uniref:Uncharacterized protein n=1 Tax=viral metagenome TaxID=1070528 RepID=A0A6C0HSH6_9ZZZZ